jgi:hypothetical protein
VYTPSFLREGGSGIFFDEMQNGAIWGHFRVSYNIEGHLVLRRLKTYVMSTMKNDTD